MSRGGHNWKGGGTVDGARSLEVMKLARAGYLSVPRSGSWHWSYRDGTVASIQIKGGRQAVNLDYRVKASGGDWKLVHQRVPICWIGSAESGPGSSAMSTPRGCRRSKPDGRSLACAAIVRRDEINVLKK
jgi:hypothetical protein